MRAARPKRFSTAAMLPPAMRSGRRSGLCSPASKDQGVEHGGDELSGESPEYRAARERLLEREIELRRLTEAVAAERRELPPGGVVPEGSSCGRRAGWRACRRAAL